MQDDLISEETVQHDELLPGLSAPPNLKREEMELLPGLIASPTQNPGEEIAYVSEEHHVERSEPREDHEATDQQAASDEQAGVETEAEESVGSPDDATLVFDGPPTPTYGDLSRTSTVSGASSDSDFVVIPVPHVLNLRAMDSDSDDGKGEKKGPITGKEKAIRVFVRKLGCVQSCW